MPWQKLYESCVGETNPHKLQKLIFEVEDAIVFRYHDLTRKVTGPDGSDELEAVRQAARRLYRLKIAKLGWLAAAKPTLMDEIRGESDAVRAAWHTGIARIQAALLATQNAWQRWVFKSLK